MQLLAPGADPFNDYRDMLGRIFSAGFAMSSLLQGRLWWHSSSQIANDHSIDRDRETGKATTMLRAARAGWHAARCGVRLPCRHLSLLPEGQPVSHETFAQLMEQLPEHGQVPGTDPVAVAVSGGPDSMALAFLAHNYLKQLGVPSVALCVDHGLRQSSADEARLVADTVASWGMVAKVKKLKWEHGAPETGKLQELAREQRQQAVAAMAANVKAK